MSIIEEAEAKRKDRDDATKALEELHRAMVAEFDEATGAWRTHSNLDMFGYAFEQANVRRPSTAESVVEGVALISKLTVMFPVQHGETARSYQLRISEWLEKLYRSGVKP